MFLPDRLQGLELMQVPVFLSSGFDPAALAGALPICSLIQEATVDVKTLMQVIQQQHFHVENRLHEDALHLLELLGRVDRISS